MKVEIPASGFPNLLPTVLLPLQDIPVCLHTYSNPPIPEEDSIIILRLISTYLNILEKFLLISR